MKKQLQNIMAKSFSNDIKNLNGNSHSDLKFLYGKSQAFLEVMEFIKNGPSNLKKKNVLLLCNFLLYKNESLKEFVFDVSTY